MVLDWVLGLHLATSACIGDLELKVMAMEPEDPETVVKLARLFSQGLVRLPFVVVVTRRQVYFLAVVFAWPEYWGCVPVEELQSTEEVALSLMAIPGLN